MSNVVVASGRILPRELFIASIFSIKSTLYPILNKNNDIKAVIEKLQMYLIIIH